MNFRGPFYDDVIKRDKLYLSQTNKNSRTKFDVGQILVRTGCEMSSKK